MACFAAENLCVSVSNGGLDKHLIENHHKRIIKKQIFIEKQ